MRKIGQNLVILLVEVNYSDELGTIVQTTGLCANSSEPEVETTFEICEILGKPRYTCSRGELLLRIGNDWASLAILTSEVSFS